MWSWPAFFEFLATPVMLSAAWTTVWLTIVSMLGGFALGCVITFLRTSRLRPLAAFAAFYVWIFRGTPLLVQLIIVFTGLPQIGVKLDAITAAILTLALNEAAYLSEIIRSGLSSVPKGQVEAARSLGMAPRLVMVKVVFPQAFRIMVPPLGNSVNGMLKTTTLVSFISVTELLRETQLLYQGNFKVLEGLCAAALYYLVMTTIWGFVQTKIEKRMNRSFAMDRGPRSDRRRITRDLELTSAGGQR
jgi:polar amino acid transport system permease protein